MPFSKHFRSLDFLWLTAPDFELHAASTRLDCSSIVRLPSASNPGRNYLPPNAGRRERQWAGYFGAACSAAGRQGAVPARTAVGPSARRSAASLLPAHRRSLQRDRSAGALPPGARVVFASSRSLKAGSFPQSKRLGRRFGLFQSLAASAVTPEERSNRSRNSVPDSTCPKGIREEDARKSR